MSTNQWDFPGVFSWVYLQVRLTKHGLQSDQAADEAVEVDVHVLVSVAHGDDVIQLVVETEAWAGHKTHDCDKNIQRVSFN